MKESVMKKFKLFLVSLVLASAASPAHAATLTAVPMQGGMVMPMLSYSAADGRMHVMTDPAVPQLTPLLESNPGDGFDPADPWFDALDPTRQGHSFSRRYGFTMNTVTDPLPAGTQMWIRMLAGTPGLSAYRYTKSAPNAFDPIFGTAGTTNALFWNGMMFHPTFTAPPGTNTYSATFEAYLADAGTGAEVAGSGTGPFILEWTDVPDGRPVLEIGQRIVIFRPDTAANSVLEGTDALVGGAWTPVTNTPVTVEGRTAVVLAPGEQRRFFRMKFTP
jgi:hypothetical protein